jgi:hypothetical protein
MPVMPELEKLSRQELIDRALRFGVPRPELMTRVELTDEIVRRSETDPSERKRARGWLGIARDLLASVVEQGLHLPDAAALIRGDVSFELGARAPAPVATVTLSEIYAAQGHLDRAVKMLDQVLEKEPDHDPARALRDKLIAERDRRAAAKAAARAREAERAGEAGRAVVEEPEAALESEANEALELSSLGSQAPSSCPSAAVRTTGPRSSSAPGSRALRARRCACSGRSRMAPPSATRAGCSPSRRSPFSASSGSASSRGSPPRAANR